MRTLKYPPVMLKPKPTNAMAIPTGAVGPAILRVNTNRFTGEKAMIYRPVRNRAIPPTMRLFANLHLIFLVTPPE